MDRQAQNGEKFWNLRNFPKVAIEFYAVQCYNAIGIVSAFGCLAIGGVPHKPRPILCSPELFWKEIILMKDYQKPELEVINLSANEAVTGDIPEGEMGNSNNIFG